MTEFRRGDRVSLEGTVVDGYPNQTLVKVPRADGLGVYVVGLNPERLTLVSRAQPNEPDVSVAVGYSSKTYIRTVLGWILVQDGKVVGNKLRTFEQMLEWEDVTFRPAIERYWAEQNEKPGHGEPL